MAKAKTVLMDIRLPAWQVKFFEEFSAYAGVPMKHVIPVFLEQQTWDMRMKDPEDPMRQRLRSADPEKMPQQRARP